MVYEVHSGTPWRLISIQTICRVRRTGFIVIENILANENEWTERVVMDMEFCFASISSVKARQLEHEGRIIYLLT